MTCGLEEPFELVLDSIIVSRKPTSAKRIDKIFIKISAEGRNCLSIQTLIILSVSKLTLQGTKGKIHANQTRTLKKKFI